MNDIKVHACDEKGGHLQDANFPDAIVDPLFNTLASIFKLIVSLQ